MKAYSEPNKGKTKTQDGKRSFHLKAFVWIEDKDKIQ